MPEKGSPQIGPYIQDFRKKRALTLDDLAKLSGVSRSMLSQIERGQANPSLATVWSLAKALDVDISHLIAGQVTEHEVRIELASASFTPQIRTDDGSCTLRILSPPDHAERMEWYELLFHPDGSLNSEAHARGTREHLTVIEGLLEVVAGDDRVSVPAGATARYPADVPHRILNIGDGHARAMLVMTT